MCDTSAEARDKLVEALELDLIGPLNGHPFERELLPRSPRTWYLTGMLVPVDAKVEAREDPASDHDIDEDYRYRARPRDYDPGDVIRDVDVSPPVLRSLSVPPTLLPVRGQ